jgi:DNA-binding transcriptional regulator YiaG
MIAFPCKTSHFRARMKPSPDAGKSRKRPGPGRPTLDQVGKRYAAELRGAEIHPVALKLKAWRLRNGLSQPQAAAVLCGFYFYVTHATLRAWEEGRNRLRDDKAALLERLLKDHPTVSEPPDAGRPAGRKGV